jgi:hypothetical protein
VGGLASSVAEEITTARFCGVTLETHGEPGFPCPSIVPCIVVAESREHDPGLRAVMLLVMLELAMHMRVVLSL